MRVAGTASWRLETRSADLAELALFVRDATRLEVSGIAVPPLFAAIPDLGDVLSSDERKQAAAQWPSWWQRVLDFELADRALIDGASDVRAIIAARQAVGDPPEFGALADRPALRTAARASVADFLHRQRGRDRHDLDKPPRPPLGWELIKQVAEDVAFDRRVGLDAVRGIVAILPVRSVWWARVAPGAALCSDSAARDPRTAAALLHDVFESNLRNA